MKIFKFDPTTGKRGEQIDNVPRAEGTSFGLDYAIREGVVAPIDYVLPKAPKDQRWTAHADAFTGHSGREVSLLRDEWICFCLGCFSAGAMDEGTWEWAVLPPKSLIKYL